MALNLRTRAGSWQLSESLASYVASTRFWRCTSMVLCFLFIILIILWLLFMSLYLTTQPNMTALSFISFWNTSTVVPTEGNATENATGLPVEGCFPETAILLSSFGPRKISSLQIGDEVTVVLANGSIAFSPIIAWLRRDRKTKSKFTVLQTERSQLMVTNIHLVFYTSNNSPNYSLSFASAHSATAHKLRVGDFLYSPVHSAVVGTGSNNWVTVSPIQGIKQAEGIGLYAPLTAEGTLLVDSVVVSCYGYDWGHAAIDHKVIHNIIFRPFIGLLRIANQILQISTRDFLLTPSEGQYLAYAQFWATLNHYFNFMF